MCLITKTIEFKIAEEDIICYKIVKITDWELGYCVTPYIGFQLQFMHKYDDSEPLEFVDRAGIADDYAVRRGVFHTFKNYDDALYELEHTWTENYKVVNCIIPKGTEYLEGEFYNWDKKYASYGSKSIVVKEGDTYVLDNR